MPIFEVKTADGKVFEVNAPDANAASQALQSVADFPRRAANMTHQQMVDAYRATKPGDMWGDFLASQIQKPMAGETPETAAKRAGGTGTTARVDMPTYAKSAATLLQGVPFVGEYADEGLGKVSELIGQRDQESATAAIRAAQADLAESNPKSAAALKFGGGLAGAAVGAGFVPWYMPQSLGMASLYGAGTGGLLGAAEGAVSGYGSGTDAESRKANAGERALIGGALGTIVGGAAPAVASGIGSGVRWGLDQLNVAQRARALGLSRPSYEHLVRQMEADGSLSGQGAANIAAAGPEAMLADAGPNAVNTLDVAVQRSGPAGNLATGRIEGRAARTSAQANDALDSALGVPRGIDTMQENIRTGTQAARQNAYDAAYSTPINYAHPQGQALEQMLPQIPADVLRTANRIMQVRREPQSAQLLIRQMPDGSVRLARLPDVRQWDYITRAMNELANGQEGRGALGGQTAVGAGFESWANDIRRTLRNLVPEYGTALNTAGDAIANRQALMFGERLLSPGTSRDEVARMLNGMTDVERRHMSAGVRSYIDEQLANVKRAITDNNMGAREAMKAVKDLSSRAAREKLTALLGRQEADTLFTQLDQAARGLELRAGVADNSATFARTSTNKMVEDAATGGILGRVRSGEPLNTGKEVWRSLLGGTDAANVARADRVFSELADVLTRQRVGNYGPQEILRDLQAISVANPRNAALARRFGNILGYPIAAPAAYQLGTQGLLGEGR